MPERVCEKLMPILNISNSDLLAEYQYTISEFYIIFKDETINLPIERIADFKIEHYFDEASFPIFKLNLVLEPSRYYKILKNKTTVKFKLRLQSFYEKFKTEEKSLYTDVFNDTFSMFIADDNNDYETELKRDGNRLNDENELDRLKNNVELFLFKDNIVSGLRSSFNAVLTNVNMSTAVTYLLYKAGVKNVLMSPFENTRVYPNVVLPPLSIDKQLKYLNNNYGFHTKGTMIYFGLLHSYVLNCASGCTAWSNGEWKETVLCVLDKSYNTSYLSGAIKKYGEQRYYYNTKTEGIDISASTMVSNVITGTDAAAITAKSGSLTTVESKSLIRDKSNKAILFNDTSNPFMAETFAAQQYGNATTISITLENLAMESFTPNKVFSFIFEDPNLNAKYKGTYRLSSSVYSFTPAGTNYKVTALLVFKRTK